jgi:hypothetical protein
MLAPSSPLWTRAGRPRHRCHHEVASILHTEACGFLSLAFLLTLSEAADRRTGGSMKQHQPREASPLWVWLALVLLACGTAAYATGYFMIDELLTLWK